MTYEHIVPGVFLSRPNRFIAHALADGREVICHVKNTGRLKELLCPGASILLEYHPDAEKTGRKTAYSLVGVYKEPAGYAGERLLINMDSEAPNRAAKEWLKSGAFSARFSKQITDVRREVTYGNSRFDLAFAEEGKQNFMEVKGVTLEQDGAACFPDAPTERGVKHIHELMAAAAAGYGAYLLFVIQMKGVRSFSPNRSTHPAFADALALAAASGVRVLAFDCAVTENSMEIDQPVPVKLT